MIINVGVFLLQAVVKSKYPMQMDPITRWFSVFPYSILSKLSVWRLLTYQFLHADFWHIAFNMLGLYFLGPTLERHWTSNRFLGFYLACGAAGGILYTFLSGWLGVGPMVGASGAIYALLAACAILFPQFVVFFIVFPVPIRVASVVIVLGALYNVIIQGVNAGGDAAHFGGMVAGATYVFTQGYWNQWLYKFNHVRHHRQAAQEINLHDEVERILEKVHNSGLHSLNSKEKAVLKRATEEEQKRNRR
ncbi:MAG: rhomboid family intramembrane serine protease [Phycisphaerae bacterium]|nr:rhomboid family intramembrane serine protease [Phycisphaerae bacterium]